MNYQGLEDHAELEDIQQEPYVKPVPVVKPKARVAQQPLPRDPQPQPTKTRASPVVNNYDTTQMDTTADVTLTLPPGLDAQTQLLAQMAGGMKGVVKVVKSLQQERRKEKAKDSDRQRDRPTDENRRLLPVTTFNVFKGNDEDVAKTWI